MDNKGAREMIDTLDINLETIKHVTESNRIEGIERFPTDAELEEHERFIAQPDMDIGQILQFLDVYQSDAVLRNQLGVNVRVGSHIPPPGGPDMENDLERLLKNNHNMTPHELHVEYEALHPFTDGNGRSGRALWYWHMECQGQFTDLGFLHLFYYQALTASREKR